MCSHWSSTWAAVSLMLGAELERPCPSSCSWQGISSPFLCALLCQLLPDCHIMPLVLHHALFAHPAGGAPGSSRSLRVSFILWKKAWPIAPVPVFLCQPLWHELQAAVGPSLSFPSSGNSPVPLPGALHSRSCQSQSHSPASFSGMRSGTFSRSTPLPLPHF